MYECELIYNDVNLSRVDGFRVLRVEGRETFDVDITAEDLAGNGSRYTKRRLPDRTLRVFFAVTPNLDEVETQTARRNWIAYSFERLNGYLNTEPSKLIFTDENGVYWNAIYKGGDITTEGTNGYAGTLDFVCLDPFKHDITASMFEGEINEDGEIQIDIVNDGTVDAPISYELTMNHENGYIGIYSERGAMEYGDPQEADTASGTRSVELLNLKTGAEILGAMDTTKCITTGAHARNGAFSSSTGWLSLGSAGSGSAYHGAGGQIALSEPCEAFKLSFKPYFATHKTVAQCGLMEIVVGDENDEILCDVHINKGSTGNNNASLIFKVKGANVASGDVYKETYACWGTGGDPKTGGYTNETAPEIYFSKNGDTFEVCFHGKTHAFVVPEAANKKAKTVNIFIGGYKTNTLVTYMRVKNLSFVKLNEPFYYDIPNRYKAGDVVYIDGEEKKIYVNGNEQARDEVKGTVYFEAPKLSDVRPFSVMVTVSDFCTTPPTVKAYVRRASI